MTRTSLYHRILIDFCGCNLLAGQHDQTDESGLAILLFGSFVEDQVGLYGEMPKETHGHEVR